MTIYTKLQEKYLYMFSFYFKKKNKDIIVQAIEDFYNNDVKVWEIDKVLPFIV